MIVLGGPQQKALSVGAASMPVIEQAPLELTAVTLEDEQSEVQLLSAYAVFIERKSAPTASNSRLNAVIDVGSRASSMKTGCPKFSKIAIAKLTYG